MFEPTYDDMVFIGLFLEGFFYGIYSGIFSMYLRYRVSKKDANKTQNIIFYAICSLYVLSGTVFACDLASTICGQFLGTSMESLLRIEYLQGTSFGCCDFIAQFILIYRCWIVWGHNIRVVIMPSILALAFLVTWLAGNSSAYISSDTLSTPQWGDRLTLSGLALSLTVNTLVTGLIVLRIFKVFREIKTTSDDRILGDTGSKLRRIVFILIESGMALFSIQLARLVVSFFWTDAAERAFNIIITMHEMLTGITPTIILVRTSMGLSFHDEKSMEEVAVGSLRFASDQLNSFSEMGSIGFASLDGKDSDISVQGSHDMDTNSKA